ncbi:LANO_0D06810g1_1 [Lachancea nothofagi CBS 11611]|uniref:LANO_0D06810g1_1 n=1 Tax=Lachancea nothofagi CBS 11611 TaxID=1266666 RepID=A0A1G4JHM7_9SACH|nr:LANO_0D06810g1_1 [Lachancea nothofagi CBS 11611]
MLVELILSLCCALSISALPSLNDDGNLGILSNTTGCIDLDVSHLLNYAEINSRANGTTSVSYCVVNNYNEISEVVRDYTYALNYGDMDAALVLYNILATTGVATEQHLDPESEILRDSKAALGKLSGLKKRDVTYSKYDDYVNAYKDASPAAVLDKRTVSYTITCDKANAPGLGDCYNLEFSIQNSRIDLNGNMRRELQSGTCWASWSVAGEFEESDLYNAIKDSISTCVKYGLSAIAKGVQLASLRCNQCTSSRGTGCN